MSYDQCPDCGGMAWPDIKRCATCEIKRLTKALDEERAIINGLRENNRIASANEALRLDEAIRFRAQRDEARASLARAESVIAGTAYPNDENLTRAQAFHGWEVANRQRDGYAQRVLALEAESARLRAEVDRLRSEGERRFAEGVEAAKEMLRSSLGRTLTGATFVALDALLPSAPGPEKDAEKMTDAEARAYLAASGIDPDAAYKRLQDRLAAEGVTIPDLPRSSAEVVRCEHCSLPMKIHPVRWMAPGGTPMECTGRASPEGGRP